LASLYLILDVKDAARSLRGREEEVGDSTGVKGSSVSKEGGGHSSGAASQYHAQAATLETLYRAAMLAVDNARAVDTLVATMKTFPGSEPLQESCCYALAGLALTEKKVASSAARKGQPSVVPTTSQPQVAQAVLVAKTRHANDAGVQNAALSARDALIALGSPQR
jgi:hypothetical protein